MNDPDFCTRMDQNELLVQIIQTAKKEDYLGAQQLLQQTYEQSSGLHDYLHQARVEQTLTEPAMKRPLSSMAFHKGEDTYLYSKVFDVIKAYADNNVKEFYHLSLTEFLTYPHVVCEFILKDSAKRLSAKVGVVDDVIKDMKSIGNK